MDIVDAMHSTIKRADGTTPIVSAIAIIMGISKVIVTTFDMNWVITQVRMKITTVI